MSEWKIPSPFLVRLRNVWSHGEECGKCGKQLLQRWSRHIAGWFRLAMRVSQPTTCRTKVKNSLNITPKKAFITPPLRPSPDSDAASGPLRAGESQLHDTQRGKARVRPRDVESLHWT